MRPQGLSPLLLATVLLPLATACGAEPDSLSDRLKPGAVIVLPAGDHPLIRIEGRTFDPPVTIDASRARVAGVSLRGVQGLRWKGGTVVAPEGRHPSHPTQGYAVVAHRSSDLTFEDMRVTEAGRAFVFGRSHGITLRRIDISGVRAEGVNLGISDRALIEDVRCSDFTPNPKTRDESGKVIRDGDHPDCIQAWTAKDSPPMTDIVVRRVTARGQMQGIFMGNRGRRGTGAGYSRVLIEDNDIEVTYPNGIYLSAATDSVIRNNRVATMPGGRYQDTTIRIPSGEAVTCGNRIEGPGAVRAKDTGRRCSAAELAFAPALAR